MSDTSTVSAPSPAIELVPAVSPTPVHAPVIHDIPVKPPADPSSVLYHKGGESSFSLRTASAPIVTSHVYRRSCGSLFRIIHTNQFLNRCDWGFRMALGTFFGAMVVLLVTDPHIRHKYLTQVFLIPVMSLICTNLTLGMSITVALQIIFCTFWSSLLCWLLLLMGLSHDDRIATGFVIAAVMFATYWYCHIPTVKKIFAGNVVVILIANVVTPDGIEKLYPWTLLFCNGMGCVFGVASVILPFPRPATIEVEDLFISTTATANYILTLLLRAFCSLETVHSHLYLARARGLLEDTYIALSTMETRIQEARLEPRICSMLMSPFGAYAWARLELHMVTLEGIIHTLSTMHAGLDRLDYDTAYHAAFVLYLDRSLSELSEKETQYMQQVLDAATDNDVRDLPSLKDFEQALRQLNTDYEAARLHFFYRQHPRQWSSLAPTLASIRAHGPMLSARSSTLRHAAIPMTRITRDDALAQQLLQTRVSIRHVSGRSSRNKRSRKKKKGEGKGTAGPTTRDVSVHSTTSQSQPDNSKLGIGVLTMTSPTATATPMSSLPNTHREMDMKEEEEDQEETRLLLEKHQAQEIDWDADDMLSQNFFLFNLDRVCHQLMQFKAEPDFSQIRFWTSYIYPLRYVATLFFPPYIIIWEWMTHVCACKQKTSHDDSDTDTDTEQHHQQQSQHSHKTNSQVPSHVQSHTAASASYQVATSASANHVTSNHSVPHVDVVIEPAWHDDSSDDTASQSSQHTDPSSHDIHNIHIASMPLQSALELPTHSSSSTTSSSSSPHTHNPITYLLSLPHGRRTVEAMKMTIAVSLASLIGLIEGSSSYFRNPFWAALAVCYLVSDHVGATFYQSALRLIGTSIGGIYAFVIVQFLYDSKPGLTICLCVFVMLCGLVRGNTNISYAGLVGAFTAAIITLGGLSPGVNPSDFVLQRIQLNFIGVVCLLLVMNLIFPVRATDLLRTEVISSLSLIESCFESSFNNYMTEVKHVATHLTRIQEEPPSPPPQQQPHQQPTASAASIAAQLSSCITKQAALLIQAKTEPTLWKKPFEAKPYETIGKIERHIWRLLLTMDQSCQQIRLNHSQFLLPDLDHQFTQIKSRLVHTLSSLGSELRSPVLHIDIKLLLQMHRSISTLELLYQRWVDSHITDRLRQHHFQLTKNQDIIALGAFLYATRGLLNLSMELGEAVQSLLLLEHPDPCDDI